MANVVRSLFIGESARHFLDTVSVLVAREFRMRYKGSLFGILWALLSPLGTVVVLQFLFTRVIPIAVPNFSVFLYSGLLPFVWFQTAVQTSTTTLSDNRDLVRTPFFAKTLLPWSVTLTNFVLYLLAFPVLLGLMAYNRIPFTIALSALPAIWLVEGLLTLSLSVMIAAIGVIVRDVQHLVAVVLVFWFYLTPIFYDISQIPSSVSRWFMLNPMTAVVSAHRAVTLYGQFPDWLGLGYATLLSLVLLGLSMFVFRSLEDAFVEEA
jgi:lipopolysaccharide transport system permease protein